MKTNKKLILTLAATAISATAAQAGGFSTDGVNPGGALFNDKSLVIQGALGYAMPQRRYTGAMGTNQTGADPGGSTSSDATPNYFLLSGDLKVGINENIDCAVRGHQPYFLDNEVSSGFEGEYVQSSFQIDSVGIDGTCSYKFDVGKGYRMRVIAGVTSTDFEASRSNQANPFYLAAVNAVIPQVMFPGSFAGDYTNTYAFEADRGYGYRLGASFEIPQYALRAQVIYDSAIDLELEGTQRVYNATEDLLNTPAYLDLELPQSVSARIQSGINETTLLYGGVRWMDWSEVQTLNILVPVNPFGALNKVLSTGYSDGWTVEAGVQKKLTEDLSGSFGVKWDKGIGGGYTDTWSMNGGLAYDLDENWRVSFGGSISLLTSSTETSGVPYEVGDSPGGGGSGSFYRQGDDWAYAIGTRIQYSMK